MRYSLTIILLVGLSFFDKSVQEPSNLKSNVSEALYSAIEAGETDVVTSLIENGTDINGVDEGRHSYLQYAVIHGKTEIVKTLLEHGANLSTEIYDSCENSALHWSAVNGKVETANLLLEHGAEINATNCDGRTPLGVAALFGNAQMVELLIKHGAGIHSAHFRDAPPFALAAMFGHLEICKILIANGVNNSDRVLDGSLYVTSFNGTKELAEYLIEIGANVNGTFFKEVSPLHGAFRWGNEEVKKVLIDHGADQNAKDVYDKTPSEIDSEKEIKEKVAVLAYLEKYREGKVMPTPMPA